MVGVKRKLKQGRIKNSRSDSKIDTENNQNKNSLFKKKFFKNYSKINFDKPADPENLVIKENINYDTNRNYNTTGNEEKNINKNNEKKFQNDSDETIEREEMKDDVIFNVDSFKYNENIAIVGGIILIFILRMCAYKYKWNLPKAK